MNQERKTETSEQGAMARLGAALADWSEK